MKPTLSEAISLARQAGEILRVGYEPRPGFGHDHWIEYKGAIDLVTEVDHRSEDFLIAEIRRRFPEHRIVTEESGVLSGHERCQWFIDPLDGTVNFAHGVPIFAVSLAYAEAGEVQLGVVYDPMQDECFSAERGEGAWLDGQPIRPSSTPDLDHSLLVTGFAYDMRTNPVNNLDQFARFSLRSQGVRRLGSAALDLGYVAAGRFDGYWELTLKPWDLAAGSLIATEAGAVVTDLQGGPGYLSPPYSIVAANPQIHAQMLLLLNENGQ